MKLKIWLETKGIRPATFAKQLGCSHTTIGRYLNGERLPRRNILMKIDKVTEGEVTANDFIN